MEAVRLFAGHLPANTVLTIEETNCRIMAKYIYRLTYISKTSGRQLCITARGSSLPEADDDTLRFYLRQLILSPTEVQREFSKLYFLERRARQDEFLFSGKNTRVSADISRKDKLGYDQYSYID